MWRSACIWNSYSKLHSSWISCYGKQFSSFTAVKNLTFLEFQIPVTNTLLLKLKHSFTSSYESIHFNAYTYTLTHSVEMHFSYLRSQCLLWRRDVRVLLPVLRDRCGVRTAECADIIVTANVMIEVINWTRNVHCNAVPGNVPIYVWQVSHWHSCYFFRTIISY